jgi:hypothetical protein
MTKLKLFSVDLIVAVMAAAPASARESHSASRHAVDNAYASAAPRTQFVGRQSCTPAPRVGAFATAPWTDHPPCEPAPVY